MNQNKFNWKRILFGLKEEQSIEDKKITLKILCGIIVLTICAYIFSYFIIFSDSHNRAIIWERIKENSQNPWFRIIMLALLARIFGPPLIRFVQRNAFGDDD